MMMGRRQCGLCIQNSQPTAVSHMVIAVKMNVPTTVHSQKVVCGTWESPAMKEAQGRTWPSRRPKSTVSAP